MHVSSIDCLLASLGLLCPVLLEQLRGSVRHFFVEMRKKQTPYSLEMTRLNLVLQLQCRYSSVMQDAPYWRAGWHEDGSGQFWRPCRGAIVVLVSGARRHGCGGKHAREGKRGSRHGVWVCQMFRVGRTLCLLVLHVLVSCAVEMRHYFIRFNS